MQRCATNLTNALRRHATKINSAVVRNSARKEMKKDKRHKAVPGRSHVINVGIGQKTKKEKEKQRNKEKRERRTRRVPGGMRISKGIRKGIY